MEKQKRYFGDRMKERKIVTFGCSWTAGDELERNEEGDYVYDSSVRDTWS